MPEAHGLASVGTARGAFIGSLERQKQVFGHAPELYGSDHHLYTLIIRHLLFPNLHRAGLEKTDPPCEICQIYMDELERLVTITCVLRQNITIE
jgi:hypothetical protein